MLFNPNPESTLIKDNHFTECIASIHETLEKYCHRGHFASYDGAQMYYEFYLAKNASASILVLHGLSEFTKKYEELTWYFLNNGYNVFLYDLRGHGYSYHELEDLQMIHINSFDEYVRDTDYFANQIVKPNSSDLPLYIYGHSMGGAIASIYVSEHAHVAEKLLLSCPLVAPCMSMPHPIMKFLSTYSVRHYGPYYCMNPEKRFNPESKGSNNPYVSQSRFKHYMKLRCDDEHYQSTPMTMSWMHNALLLKKRLTKPLKKKIHIPLLILNAEKDTTVVNKVHKQLARRFENATIQTIPNIDHALYSGTDEIMPLYVNTILQFFSQSS